MGQYFINITLDTSLTSENGGQTVPRRCSSSLDGTVIKPIAPEIIPKAGRIKTYTSGCPKNHKTH